MKQLKAVLVGFGNRGEIYADYSLKCPNELKIVGVVEIDANRLKEAQARYGLADDQIFSSLETFLRAKLECDFVINATMDQMHYETAIEILKAGYNMLIEKPVTAKKEELLEIESLAKEKGVRVFVCHVLRYTPFYSKIKQCLDEGKIGDILSMELNEHVGIAHFTTAFVPGRWSSERQCGSPLLLAKCCHDTDLLCWLNNKTTPTRVSSFGSRNLFVKDKAPKDSTERCIDCPHSETCLYDAKKICLSLNKNTFEAWVGSERPFEEIDEAEKIELLKTSNYGKCVYKSWGDIVDRQNMIVEYENGSVATLTLVAAAMQAGRWIHIVGTKGTIIGMLEEGKFTLREFNMNGSEYGDSATEFDVNADIAVNDDHLGGDFALMRDITRYFAGKTISPSLTNIEDSINGHLIVYAAEESRKNHSVSKIR